MAKRRQGKGTIIRRGPHRGEQRYTTKATSADFHRAGHDIKLYHGKHQIRPYSRFIYINKNTIIF